MANKAEITISAVDQTKKAFSSAKKGLGELDEGTKGLAARFGTIGIAIAAVTEGVNFKNIIDGADQLSKLSQKTGIAVENLAALKYAGELSDVSVEELGKGIQKLSVNMADAAGGGKESAAAFKAIGVEVKNSSGALRNTDDVLGEVADKFASYKDGAAKAALAQQLFGKGGAALIPLLNSGKQGLADMASEAKQLGVVFGDDLAKQAEAFNDNLTRLKTGLEGGKVALLGSFLPALNSMLTELVEGRKVFGSFTSALFELGLSKPFDSYGAGATDARERIDKLNETLQRTRQISEQNQAAGEDTSFADNDAKRIEAKLATAAKRLEYFKRLQAAEALKSGEGIVDERRFQAPAKTDAPALDKAEAERSALQRKELDGRLKRLQDGLANERDVYAFQAQYLERVYTDGQISVDQFYGEKEKAQLDYLKNTKAAFTAEIAALRAFQEQATKPEEKQDAENKIAEVLTQRAALERESAQAAVIAAGDRVRANDQLRKSVADLEAQLSELNGDSYTAALIKIGQQTEAFQKTLKQAGADQGRAGQLEAALKNQALFNKLRTDYSEITERASVAEERYLLKADQEGASRAEVEAKVKALRTASLEQLDALIEKTTKLNEVSQDPAVLLYLEQLRLAREKASAESDPSLVRTKALATEAGASIADSFETAALQGGKLSDVLKDIGANLLKLAYNDAVTKPLAQSFSTFIQSSLQEFKGALAQIGQLLGGSGFGTNTGGGAGGVDYTASTPQAGARDGAAIGPGGWHAFAKGGAFTNKVFNSPTAFKFRNGNGFSNGVMGEAGDEAVMPLKRGPGGKLGVQLYGQAAQAGGGGQAPIINVHNYGEPASAQVQTSTDSQGRLTVDVMLDAVANDIRRGGKVSAAGQAMHGWRRNAPRR
ncbi:MAG: hypothetical protein ABI605_10865 [Rhizobacter sp.]